SNCEQTGIKLPKKTRPLQMFRNQPLYPESIGLLFGFERVSKPHSLLHRQFWEMIIQEDMQNRLTDYLPLLISQNCQRRCIRLECVFSARNNSNALRQNFVHEKICARHCLDKAILARAQVTRK